MTARLTALYRYPVKSMRGEPLEQAEVEPWGLAGDRRWMVVDPAGQAVTAREVHDLLLLRPEITASGLRLHAAGREPLPVDLPDPERQVAVGVGSRSRTTATPAGPVADGWLSELLGRDVRLVHLDDPTRRPTNPEYGDPADRVSLADGYPMLLTTEESLAALNDTVLAAGDLGREAVPVIRFRTNLVVAGVPAWAEDDWRRVRVGEVVFRAVKGCARCVMTTLDPDTAEREHEPLRSLARSRRWDGATWFGVNLVPDDPGATIRVGDPVEVLESASPGDGPLRKPVASAP